MSFAARFRGVCPECGEPIEIGDQLVNNGDGTYQHTVCPEAEAERPTKFVGTTLEEMGF